MILKAMLLFLISIFASRSHRKDKQSIRYLHNPAKVKTVSGDLTSKTRRFRKTQTYNDRNPDLVCDLSARVYPLLFRSQTGFLEFRLSFQSTCLEDPLLMYFVLDPERSDFLTHDAHPVFVRLSVFGVVFTFKFADPFKRGSREFLNIAYRYVRVFPSNRIVNINTFEENIVPLNKKNIIGYPREMVMTIDSTPIRYCSLRKNNSEVFCKLE